MVLRELANLGMSKTLLRELANLGMSKTLLRELANLGMSRNGPCPPGQGHSSQLAGPIRHLIYTTATWEAVGNLI
jgi:hypothetical protein